VKRTDSSKNVFQWQQPMHKGREGRNVAVNNGCGPFMSRWEDCVAFQLEAIELSCAMGHSNYCHPLREMCAIEKITAHGSPVPLQLKRLFQSTKSRKRKSDPSKRGGEEDQRHICVRVGQHMSRARKVEGKWKGLIWGVMVVLCKCTDNEGCVDNEG
jgi:hypothetical protein